MTAKTIDAFHDDFIYKVSFSWNFDLKRTLYQQKPMQIGIYKTNTVFHEAH